MTLATFPMHPGWARHHVRSDTHCSFCALQCALRMVVRPETGEILKVWGRRDFPTTRGLSCIKGQTAHHQMHHPQRLRFPLIRRPDGTFRRAPWKEVLDTIADRWRAIQNAFGKDAVAVFGGGALTNESAYWLGKFARVVLGTRHIDYNGRYCMSSAAAALRATFGVDRGLPFPLSDILHAKTIFLVGANVAECLPPIMAFLKRAKKRGTRLVVADPRRTLTAKDADLHLPLRPGSDLALALALLEETRAAGKVAEDWLKIHATGFEKVLGSIYGKNAEWAARYCDLPAQAIREAARLLWESPALILTGRGPEQQSKGVDTVQAFLNLALCLGHFGKPGGGFATLTGQGNGQGGREHGMKADQLPGYRSIENPQHRRIVAERWGISEDELPRKGYSAQEILQACGTGEIRSLWVVASNPAVSAPNGSAVKERLQSLPFLVVSDLFLSETAKLAHVVLPACAFAEEEGTMTNIEGRVVLRRTAIAPPKEARSDRWVIRELALRLGKGKLFLDSSAEAIFQELAAVTQGGVADYSGMTYRRLERNKGLFWPCSKEEPEGRPYLFENGFFTEDGKAHLRPVTWRPCAEESDGEYPFFLTTIRVLQHYLSGNQTRRLAKLSEEVPEPFVLMNRQKAEQFGLEENDRISVESRRGRIFLPVRLEEGLHPRTLCVPFHWGEEKSVNRLTQEALDPVSRMPELKCCAVRWKKEEKPC